MRLVLSWLRGFGDVPASADEIAATIGLRGFEVASVEALPGGDAVIDFEITANRPDCLSVLGLAREVATAFDRPLTLPSADRDARVHLAPVPTGASSRLTVTIEDDELCPRYAAAIAEVTMRPSPAWMAARGGWGRGWRRPASVRSARLSTSRITSTSNLASRCTRSTWRGCQAPRSAS